MKSRAVPESYWCVEDVEEVKKLLRYMMKRYHAICEENGLFYNVFGGTMLGAIRHQGMIPWDNDIDVTMPQEDYKIFVELIRNGYSKEFDIVAYPDENYIYPYAKLILKGSILNEFSVKPKYQKLGVYVDIFPINGYPKENDEKIFEKLEKIRIINYLIAHDHIMLKKSKPVKYVIKRSISKILEMLGVNYFVKRHITLLESASFQESEDLLLYGAGWGERGRLKKSIYLDRKLYSFDGFQVWGIRDYHDHLTRLYGNYMQMPPEEERVSNHNYELYVEKDCLKRILEEMK